MYLKILTTDTWTRSEHLSWSVLVKLLGSVMRDCTSHAGRSFPIMDRDLHVDCVSLGGPSNSNSLRLS